MPRVVGGVGELQVLGNMGKGEHPSMCAIKKLYHWSAYFLAALLFSGCSKESQKSHEEQAYFNEKLSCQPPAVEQFEPWGQSGSLHTCKITHGPFVTFEWGYVRMRGQYNNGNKIGIWRWYGSDGKIEKEIDYSNPSQ